jgi:hypothetical protein
MRDRNNRPRSYGRPWHTPDYCLNLNQIRAELSIKLNLSLVFFLRVIAFWLHFSP